VTPLLTAVAAALGIIGLLGVAYAVFTSARVTKTLELYKAENEAQGKRIASLEAEDARKTERLAAVERENVVLRDLATGRSVMEALANDIRAAETLRRTEHESMMSVLSDMKDMINEMWQGMVRFFGGERRQGDR